LPFCSQETIKQLPFKIRPPKATGILFRYLMPRSKADLKPQSKNFPNPERILKSFLNGLPPDIRGLIKRQKIEWEAIVATELQTTAEHLERTLKQDCKESPSS